MALLGAGCNMGEGDDSGVLVAPFELGNRKDCQSLGIAAVRAELDGGRVVEEVECEVGQVRFEPLAPGSYEIVLYGLDAEGIPVMDSLAAGPTEVDVVGAGTTVVVDPAFKLTAAPAHLQLRWDLGFGSCDSTAIDHFGITAWSFDGSELLLETEVLCSMTGDGPDQYRLVPDLERELSGDEVGEVDIQAYDASGVTVGDSVSFAFDAPGAGRSVKLSLSCDEGGCEGSGEPD
ncbi:MAG: hypothetical protein OEZ06_11625 [Myxococcales bacterium]|nr:hypothetical protein [Myxococcales bacterium]